MISRQLRLQRESTRFFRFTVVGFIGAIVDFATFNLLVRGLGINSILASMVSFVAAVTSNFVWNRYWTYPDSRSKRISRQAAEFALVNLIGLAIRTPVFALARAPAIRVASELARLPLPRLVRAALGAVPAETIGLNLALAVSVLIVLIWNFGVNRLWTYADVE